MKNTLFVRPNLKLFLLGAIVIACVQHLITNVHSQARILTTATPVSAREVPDADFRPLLAETVNHPSAQAYLRLSQYFEKRGEYRKAILYLRRAETLAQYEDVSE